MPNVSHPPDCPAKDIELGAAEDNTGGVTSCTMGYADKLLPWCWHTSELSDLGFCGGATKDNTESPYMESPSNGSSEARRKGIEPNFERKSSRCFSRCSMA